ncbi:MAG TPA: UPF0280 family protein [bacterium]|nr:UPF0280 family protein [bacterium]
MRRRRFHFEEKTTIATLLCDPAFRRVAEMALIRSRREVEVYLLLDPIFGETHVPHAPLPGAPGIVRKMCAAAAKAGVGPMASVAGAFASAAVAEMIREGADDAVVDNGGDIALQISEPLLVGIHTGSAAIRDLAFEILPREGMLGVCASSGTVGHSFSYGRADAAVVLSPDVPLADAAATALANRVRSEADLESCFGFLDFLPEIEGALVILKDRMAMWGCLPKLVRISVDEALITCGHKAKQTL